MSDRTIRKLERTAAETGADSDILNLRRARIRAGLETLPIASLAAAERQAEPNAQAAAALAERAELAAQAADSGDALAGELAELARADAERMAAALERYPAAAGWYFALAPLQTVPLVKAANRAAKRTRAKGAMPVQVELGDDLVTLPRTRPDGSEARIALQPVRILGDIPDAGAWRFVARLHHAPEGTIIHRLRSARDLDDATLETFRARGPHCDDCISSGKGARNWHDTFVIVNAETGDAAQLGRNCLERYTGASADLAMHIFDTRERLTEMLTDSAELDTTPGALYGPSLIAFTAHLVRRESRGLATHAGAAWDDAWRFGLAPAPGQQVSPHARYPEATDIARARDIVSDARAMLIPALEGERAMLAAREAGDAEPTWPEGIARLAERWHNLSVIVAADAVSSDEARTAAGILAWHNQRAQERERAEREAQAERMQGDPSAAAAELAAALAELDITATPEGGRVTMSPRALASLLTLNGEMAALRPLARMILDGAAACQTPETHGQYFAAVGAEGTWAGCEVERVIPFRSGRGYTIKLAHPVARGSVGSATCFVRGSTDLSQGDLVNLRGQVDRHETFRGERQVIMADGFTLERV